MNAIFGRKWLPDSPLVDTPVGESCLHCSEPIAVHDEGTLMPFMDENGVKVVPMHRECFLRGVFGSVAHQQGKCTCPYGTHEVTEEPGSKRAAAIAAVFYATWEKPH